MALDLKQQQQQIFKSLSGSGSLRFGIRQVNDLT